MKALSIVAIAVVAQMTVDFALAADRVRVRGHFRKDGTYVQPHYRTAPDGRFYNNWSSYGNVNPYTGEFGKKLYPSMKKPRDLGPPFAIPATPSLPSTEAARVSGQGAALPDIHAPSPPLPSMPRDTGATSGSDFLDRAQTFEITNCDFVNMREGPAVRYPVNQRLQNGVNGIILIGKPVFNGATKWQQVNSRGVIGWVNAYYLRKSVVTSPHPISTPIPVRRAIAVAEPIKPTPVPTPTPITTNKQIPKSIPASTFTLSKTPQVERFPNSAIVGSVLLLGILFLGILLGMKRIWNVR
jgi:hypothetical protein